MDIFDFVAIVVVLSVFVIAVYSVKNGIGPVPSNAAARRQLVNLLPTKVTGHIVELGAGWGGSALVLARAFPEKSVIAVENSMPVWLFCWLRVSLSGVGNLRVKLGNIYQEDLRQAGLVYCYLYPGAMQVLKPQILQMLPGSVVISNTFSLSDMEPEQINRANDFWRSRIYRYSIPAPPSEDYRLSQ